MYQRTDQCFSLTHLLGAVKRDYGSVRYVQAEQGRTANERTSSATDAQTDQAMQEPVQLPVDARAWLPRDSPSAPRPTPRAAGSAVQRAPACPWPCASAREAAHPPASHPHPLGGYGDGCEGSSPRGATARIGFLAPRHAVFRAAR